MRLASDGRSRGREPRSTIAWMSLVSPLPDAGLLVNVLPSEIARRLKEGQQAIADHFDEASILFADVVDFTPLSSRFHPTEVVGILDSLFTSFDELTDRHGVEKIKTVGDWYMVAAGVPERRPDHAQALARMALEMLECPRTACLPVSAAACTCGSASAPAPSSPA